MPARFRIGIEMALAPELNSPMTAIVDLSLAALRAFVDVWPGSHLPAWAVESSSDLYWTVYLPTFPLTCLSASFAPLTVAAPWTRDAPWSGRLEYIVSVLP